MMFTYSNKAKFSYQKSKKTFRQIDIAPTITSYLAESPLFMSLGTIDLDLLLDF